MLRSTPHHGQLQKGGLALNDAGAAAFDAVLSSAVFLGLPLGFQGSCCSLVALLGEQLCGFNMFAASWWY